MSTALSNTPTPIVAADCDDAALQAKRRVAITANPYSGSRTNRRYVDAMAWALREQKLDPQIIWDPAHRAEQLNDPNLFDHCRCVIAAGGDGSLTDVINDLAAGGHLAGMPLAMLPMGNENLFARQFGFSRHVETTARAIARGKTLRCDLGRCNGTLFHLMASAGFDADVVHRVDRWRRNGVTADPAASATLRRINRMRYVMRTLGTLAEYNYPKIHVDDGEQQVDLAQVFIFNLPQYAAGAAICPQADPHDGLLNWVGFEKPGAWHFAQYAAWSFFGRHFKRSDVFHGSAKAV
ncbi:MAG: hypothetical protein MI741_09985, partial [Rhodospirillales bacterium]|nr:hypothetical protein [Rhodospirillales bacterium]